MKRFFRIPFIAIGLGIGVLSVCISIFSQQRAKKYQSRMEAQDACWKWVKSKQANHFSTGSRKGRPYEHVNKFDNNGFILPSPRYLKYESHSVRMGLGLSQPQCGEEIETRQFLGLEIQGIKNRQHFEVHPCLRNWDCTTEVKAYFRY